MSIKFLKHLEDNIELIKIEKTNCWSLKQLCAILGYSENGRNTAALRLFCSSNNIDISHIKGNGKQPAKTEERECLFCKKPFMVRVNTIKGSKQVTCSHYCANNYFLPNKKEEVTEFTYMNRAKKAGMTSCCVCGDSVVIDIHHVDNDRDNNEVNNLIPLCPTHHAYMHRGKSNLIMDQIEKYLDSRDIEII